MPGPCKYVSKLVSKIYTWLKYGVGISSSMQCLVAGRGVVSPDPGDLAVGLDISQGGRFQEAVKT